MAHRAASTAPAAALAFLLLLTRAAEAEPQPATGPAIIARTASDQVAVRAVRVAAALKIDGRLDESPYTTIQPISDFVQQEPREGEPATEKTDAWIFFDDASLYIAARCWDSHPEREVANELRRDNGNILGNENFTFVIDPLHDRRNGYLFQTNPLGALRDMTVTDDQQNSAWNVGMSKPAASSTAGRWRWRFPSRRCAIAAAARRNGASTCGGW